MKTEGNKYECKLTDVLQKKSSEQGVVEDGRTFFCSELVAKAYKYTGLLGVTDLASTNYRPVDL